MIEEVAGPKHRIHICGSTIRRFPWQEGSVDKPIAIEEDEGFS